MDNTIKWKRTNTGNIMFALYKGKEMRSMAVLTDDWQDRLEIDELEYDVYDTIIVKPTIKEGHRDIRFFNTVKWDGELAIEQWRKIKTLSFNEIGKYLQKQTS